jgi:hypothetical protein
MRKIIVRTTIELSDALHERLRRQSQRDDIPLARLLGSLVERGLQADIMQAPPKRQSGRFMVLAPAATGARVTASAVQKAIDETGVL